MAEASFDVVVVGAGPGGYVCAIRAAQLGLRVALVEKDAALGGTCLNVGCIPTKALLASTELLLAARHADKHGLKVGPIEVDLPALMKRKQAVVQQMNRGVQTLTTKRGIENIQGRAELRGEGRVRVRQKEGERDLEARHIVIATGSVPVALPFAPFDGKTIVSSDDAIAFSSIPKSLIVVGAGAIGLEIGSVWSRLGTKVTCLEFLPTIAAGADEDVSKLAERIFKKQGLEFSTGTKVTAVEVSAQGARLTAEQDGKPLTFEAEKVLVAVGRRAYTEGLGLEQAGVKLDERGRVAVDDHLRTSAPGVWAIGDVVAGPMLAHKAEEDGVAGAEWIAGKPGHIDWDLVPGVFYTHPEIAMVGLTERRAKELRRAVKVGTFPLAANGRAVAQGEADGMVKVIADAQTDRLLGAAIVAPGASEMIANVVAHMTYGGSAEDLARTIHAHPTISESLKEAALAVHKSAIHML